MPNRPATMPYLSRPIGELKSRYRVVIIGSGYGGGVVAHHLAGHAKEAPSICVLERGEEWRTGEFPVSPTEALSQLQVDHPSFRAGRQTGLFDLRVWPEMSVLVGCGLGGTSLINANVMLPASDDVFSTWPTAEGARGWADELKPYYTDAKRRLNAVPCPEQLDIEKRNGLLRAGAGIPPGTATQGTLESPRLAVSFASGPNEFGVPRKRCQLCGDCVTGCNHDAKNTVDRTYLAGARNHGAEIYCGITVDSIEPIVPPAGVRAAEEEAEDASLGQARWSIHARILDQSGKRFRDLKLPILANTVFLAAGSFGSTEILLRSRKAHQLALSRALGTHFSGNGDVIAFSYNGSRVANSFGYGVNVPRVPSVGPCITGMLDQPLGEHGRITIQDAAIPGALAPLIRFGAPFIARRTRSKTGRGAGGLSSEFHTLIRGITVGAVARTQTFLVMSRDDSATSRDDETQQGGTLGLSTRNRASLSWPGIARAPLFAAVNARLAELSEALGGRFVVNPMWTGRRKRLTSVHPLGGCRMGNDWGDGVVNREGEVFSSNTGIHEGLYVCDGAIVPTSIGRNPALTIAALATRIATRFVNAAPEWWHRSSIEDTGVPVNTMPSVKRRLDGDCSGEPEIRYTERLRGQVTLNGTSGDFRLVLHISADSIGKLLEDRQHETRVIGYADMRVTNGAVLHRWMVFDGRMNILASDPRQTDTRLLVYRLALRDTATAAVTYLRGHKTINLATCRQGTWKATTRFPFALHKSKDLHDTGPATGAAVALHGREPDFAGACDWVDINAIERSETKIASGEGRVGGQSVTVPRVPRIGYGNVRGSLADVFRLIASFEIRREPSRSRRVWWLARFLAFFLGHIVQARVPFLQRTQRIDPLNRPPLDETRAPESRTYFDRPVQPRFRLTRYDPPPSVKNPKHVLVAPGFGMSTDAFLIGTPSLVSYLTSPRPNPSSAATSVSTADANKPFVVWLLDYRGSDQLDASLTQFDLDDLVDDFKCAIEMVHDKAGKKVCVLAHCVASLVTSMLLLRDGKSLKCKVESVVLSQSMAFMDHPFANRLLARLRLPQILRVLGFNPVITTDLDPTSSWRAWLMDRALRLYPTVEHCSSGVCRRTLFMYGEVVHHQQLDRHTHDMMYDMFDRANLAAFDHLTRMTRAGRIVDRHGRNVYLSEANAEPLTMPITLVQGMKNRLFRPSGAKKTEAWLKKNIGAQNRVNLVPCSDYAHLDVFIGKNAAIETFPLIVKALNRTA